MVSTGNGSCLRPVCAQDGGDNAQRFVVGRVGLWHSVRRGAFHHHDWERAQARSLVHHTPGHFGTIEVKQKIEGRFDLKWQWTQPADWIWGTQYRIESPHRSGGDYIVQYWSHNLAQDKLFCSSVVYVMSTSGERQSVIRRWDGSLLPF